jgi:hypothetical protein
MDVGGNKPRSDFGSDGRGFESLRARHFLSVNEALGPFRDGLDGLFDA